MRHDPSNEQDFEVFAHYGGTMAAVQRFELAMRRLGRLLHPPLSENATYEQAWKRVEKQLKKPDGSLAGHLDGLGYPHQEVRERISQLMQTRKKLAHEVLLNYMFEKNAGVVDLQWVISSLDELEEDFWAWSNLIGEIYGIVARELGATLQDLELPLTDLRESFDREDVRLLFSAYGTAMHAVQSWEFDLKALLTYFDLPEEDEDVSFDEAWEPVAKTLTTAAGPLRSRLEEHGYRPEGLHEELETFRNHRNDLAHHFFLDYARVRDTGEPEAYNAALAFLQSIAFLFQEQGSKLGALSDQQAADRGWDLDDLGGLTEEELWRVAFEEDERDEEK